MATLQDYLGITKLRDAWPKWKANIIAINTQVINHVAGTADKHAAQDITYSGSFTSMADVKAALDQAKTEIDTIVVNASVDPEVALARVSAVKSETFATLDARLESSEQDLVSYKAETAYVLDSGDLTNLSVRLGALPQNSKIMLQPNKVYNFIEPINLSKSFQIDLNGSTINYVGAGYLFNFTGLNSCLLYTSDAADEEDSVDLGGRRIIKKKKKK